MIKRVVVAAMAAWLVGSTATIVCAQHHEERIEVAVDMAMLRLNEFEHTAYGLGGRLTYDLTSLVAFEGNVTLFPADLANESKGSATVPFSRRQIEGLFGVRVQTRRAGTRIFGSVKPGFLRFSPSAEPFFCILLFPGPPECALASGRTEFALAMGGGVIVPVARRISSRFEVSDTLVRYDLPAIRSGRTVNDFRSHNFQVNLGLGYRF